MQFYQLEPLFALAKKKVGWLVFCILVVVMVVVPYALALPNQFKATAQVMPRSVSSSPVNNLAGLASSLGGLASLTGMNFSNNTSTTNYALATANSNLFLARFIEKHDLKKMLLPEAWSAKEQNWVASKSIFEKLVDLLVKAEYDSPSEPLTEEAVIVFRDLISFADVPEYGTIEISLVWNDREAAQTLLAALIGEINYYVVALEKTKLRRQIDALVSELEVESREPIRLTLLNLLQANIEKLSSVETSAQEYAFEIIDPPTLPLKRYAPNRTKLVLGSVSAVILLYFVSIFFAYARAIDQQPNKANS
jgi:uncharacterized protein involved in exopolysaccharide biosynthesis